METKLDGFTNQYSLQKTLRFEMKDKDGKFKPTFVVLEDLNPGFKRDRQKFEQQIYQNFELALAKKLNYLVDKNVPIGEIGSVAKALQLTPPVKTYKDDIKDIKQLGIMLYVRPNYTSITDPVTGWRQSIYLKKGPENTTYDKNGKIKNKSVKEQIFEKFSEIGIDEQGDYFFEYIDENTGKKWKLWSGKNGDYLERYRRRRGKDKNEIIIESYNVKKMLDGLFDEGFDKNDSLLKQLKSGKSLPKVDEKYTAWESLRFIISIIQQIRNFGDTEKGQDDNFLLSPVRDEYGEHFDSRKKNTQQPIDGDANGAYNIARKGVIMYEHIKQWINDGKQKTKSKNDKDTTDLNLFVSDKEWDLWVSDEKRWKEELKIFASRKAKEGS